MRVLLAPMEGVLDSLVRELLTSVNDYDLCITEFLRVVDQLLPVKSFLRLCPELRQQSRTSSGTLVRVQLLGQHPQWLAENAARAAELGSWGVDLNCGCPSKLVNGSGGGATLLKDPELIYRGAKAMREAVPDHLPVTVKVRLGWDSGDKRFEIADAVQQAGASELVVHGRTKEEGYRAECINWQAIGEIRQRLRIPVIANGEIWDWESAQQCMAQTGCDAVMIGRGALNVPNLSRLAAGDGAAASLHPSGKAGRHRHVSRGAHQTVARLSAQGLPRGGRTVHHRAHAENLAGNCGGDRSSLRAGNGVTVL